MDYLFSLFRAYVLDLYFKRELARRFVKGRRSLVRHGKVCVRLAVAQRIDYRVVVIEARIVSRRRFVCRRLVISVARIDALFHFEESGIRGAVAAVSIALVAFASEVAVCVVVSAAVDVCGIVFMVLYISIGKPSRRIGRAVQHLRHRNRGVVAQSRGYPQRAANIRKIVYGAVMQVGV